jgi:hypothetical protein
MSFADNNFIITVGDLTKNFKNELRNTINDCQLKKYKDLKWKYMKS